MKSSDNADNGTFSNRAEENKFKSLSMPDDKEFFKFVLELTEYQAKNCTELSNFHEKVPYMRKLFDCFE